MADPFLGEVRAYGFNFAPRGWAMCMGQILSISQNTALFSLLGVNFGGNGQTTFGLPDLQSRVPIGAGQGPGLSDRVLGERGGTENVTLTTAQLPPHSHGVRASSTAGTGNEIDGQLPAVAARPVYGSGAVVQMGDGSVRPAGGNLPHPNVMPSLVVNYCIALQGIYPQRS